MTAATELAPVRGKARIDVLDMMRGFAILGIFFMNIPFQAASTYALFADIRLLGWTAADQASWATIQILFEGTQRCLLEFLFGAGMMVIATKAMTPDGPVAIADLYMRRTMWLLVFGAVDIFLVLWVGDILSIYAVAGLFLFPFRTLGPRVLLGLGLSFALVTAVGGAIEYSSRASLVGQVAIAQQHKATNTRLTKADSTALTEWQKKLDRFKLSKEDAKKIAEEKKAHQGGALAYAQLMWGQWVEFFWLGGFFWLTVVEAFCAMLIGVAMWKWGIIQGQRSALFYLILAGLAYGFGITARWMGAQEIMAFSPQPKTIWITAEFARLAVGVGHLALFNLLVKSRIGWLVLSPFRAAGRTAFSLYYIEQIIGLHILFSPYGMNLWGRFGWAEMTAIAATMFVGLLVVANIWVRYFAMGPLEWLWRSLSYLKWQQFRHPVAQRG